MSHFKYDRKPDTYLSEHLILPDVLRRNGLASVLHSFRKVLTVVPLSAV